MIAQTATLTTTNLSLASTVFSILDSRIQFLEYQINVQFDFKKQMPTNHLSAYEQSMRFYAKTSKSLELLQVLKEWVCEKNASIVLDLIQDDDYLNYSEHQLERKIQIREFELN